MCLYTDYTKQCDDLDLIKEWTNHPARSSPNPINMVTASAEECRYDSLPRHQELAATLAADGSIVVPKTEGDGGGEADKMDIPVPRLRLREAARQVRGMLDRGVVVKSRVHSITSVRTRSTESFLASPNTAVD